MGAYVKRGNSMHWDESIPDPNPNGGSVIDGDSGKVIPGANRQSYASGPGGNGPVGSPSNPTGTYKGNVSTTPGQPFGSGGFVSGQPNKAPINPQAPNGGATPWGDWVANMLGMAGAPQTPALQTTAPEAQQTMGQSPSTEDWFTAWAQRQQQDVQAQRMAANMQQPFAQSGLPEGRGR